jgi:hypothetical protein
MSLIARYANVHDGVDSTGSFNASSVVNVGNVAGKQGQAGRFTSASSSVVDCGRIAAMEGASQLSIAFWFYRSNTSTQSARVGKTTASGSSSATIGVEAYTNGKIYLLVDRDSTGYAAISSSATGWNHVVMVFDGAQSGNDNRLKGYLNGGVQSLVFVGTVSATTSAGATGNFFIGKAYDGSFGFSDADFDDVRIYGNALTAAEVLALYNSYSSLLLRRRRAA